MRVEWRSVLDQLRQEIAALQKDNLNLYEKTRYVSTYNRGTHQTSAGTSASAYGNNPNPSTVTIGGSSGTPGIALDRYRKAYESNISPFAAFRGRESARAYGRMSFPERVVYSITRMVLASRTSRNLFAAYCVALHVLVFFALYWVGSIDVEKHASLPDVVPSTNRCVLAVKGMTCVGCENKLISALKAQDAISNIKTANGKTTFDAPFDGDNTKVADGLIVAAVVDKSQKFANAAAVAASTVYGPGLIEYN